jgi:pilus assembly protein CpaE
MPDQPTIRVLIVDDIAETRDNLEKLLFFEKDIQVIAKASTGREAVAMAKQHQPDVVLMDINLEGGREGIEVARWLSTVCEAPVVFITGYTDRDTLDRIQQQVPGAPVLPKPIYRDGLAAAVAAVGRTN